MLALSRSGRQAEALRSYQSAREVLGEHLGLEPSSELRALEAAILQQEDAVVRRDAPVASPPRTNLRTPLTSIIGRRGAMRALRPLLRAHRLVTLVGPGGVGKSRLVLEAAREWFDSDEGDIWMVEFADVGDTNGVAAAILATLDVARAGEAQGDIRRLIEFLGKRRAVLVFDNCEHLVASAAHVAQELLESCPTLTIWATSREGLSIPGEVLWPVPPLVLDDAVALFIERGLAADPVGAFGDDSAPARRALEEICTRLDGLPLAIELAAARLRTIPIGELMTGLEDRFRILNRGARTALPRQQTLRAVVDWSYDLLFDDERRVFDRLSVFRGSCTLAAAKAVCSDDDITGDDVTDLVSRLADKSLALIQSDELGGYARCRMLQTLVEYGRERLEESGDAARVYAAHGRYYSDFASRSVAALTGLKQRGWLRAVTGNLDNLRSAFDVALAEGDAETAQCIAGGLGWYWWFTGRALEGSQWLMHARGCAGEVRPLTQARVKAWTGFARTPGFVRWAESEESPYWLEVPVSGPMLDEEVDELCNDACKLYREVDAFDELAGVEIALAVAYSTRGGHDRAIELLIDAEQLLAGTDTEPHLRAMRHFAAARRAFIADEHDAAESAFRRSIELLEQTGADVHRAFAFRYVGRLAAIRGEFSESVTAIEHALKLASELSLTGFANVLMSDLGESLGLSGDFARARAVLEQPLTTARDVGFLPGIGQSLAALATLERRGWRLRTSGTTREGSARHRRRGG